MATAAAEIVEADRPLKNKRLSQCNRETLFNFATKQVRATASDDTLDAAYDTAADAIYAVMVGLYPQKDMRVLERYGQAQLDECIYVSTGGYNYDRFEFRDGDKRIPLRPGSNCNRRNPYSLEGDAQEAFDAYQAAKKAFEQQITDRLADYKALIYGANTFNEVAKVWVAAEALRPNIVGTETALTVLSNDVVSRIQSDAANTVDLAA